MLLNRIRVSNFRCLRDIEVQFEPNLTVIVGENDSGKSTLFDILRISLEGGLPEPADFYFGSKEIRCELEFSSQKVCKLEFRKNDEGKVIKTLKEIVFWGDLRSYLEATDAIDALGIDEIREVLARYGKPSRKRTLDSIKDEFRTFLEENREKIENHKEEEVEVETIEGIPELILVDGKRFENINDFVRDVYLKEDFRGIWSALIETGGSQKSLSDIFQDRLRDIEVQKQKEVNEEVLPRLQEFLPNVHRVAITIKHQTYDITKSVTVNVAFEDNEGREVSVAKKGDGTKRRTTLALLRHKAEKDWSSGNKLFLFDEPDTHLHVRAQRELINVLEKIATDNQVIITTHSPFILNSMDASNVRLLCLKDGVSRIRSLADDCEVRNVLKSLGIENTNLFFTRKILFVEGESEEVAVPILFNRYTGRYLHNELIAILNAKGRDSIPHLARIINELMSDVPITVLVDNDLAYRPKTRLLLEALEQHAEIKRFEIGYKEFEDAFDNETIYEAVRQHYAGEVNEQWTKEAIEEKRKQLQQNPHYKFGDALAKLARADKVVIAKAIARYCPKDKIPQELVQLFDFLRE